MKKKRSEASSIGMIGGTTKETHEYVIQHLGWWKGHLFLLMHRIKSLFAKMRNGTD
ncbi:hypothetical protein [Hydrogenoanaerobacterium sp.]|uniref:hypothetical protein n=1 Tax=Hydrogenoanaerobacterium sp. TaxID=2953763 RepID=UPI00289A75CE|nr:hypothetical protein [Hydrogenoanaerobacterium sp.]